ERLPSTGVAPAAVLCSRPRMAAEGTLDRRQVRCVVDTGDMDVEDFQRAWRQARAAWGAASQRKLEAEASGLPLTGREEADWLSAKTRFEEYERAWEQVYRAGVVVMAGDDDEQDEGTGLA